MPVAIFLLLFFIVVVINSVKILKSVTFFLLIKENVFSVIRVILPQTSNRIVEVKKYLWRSCAPTPPFKTGPATAGCPGLCPVSL